MYAGSGLREHYAMLCPKPWEVDPGESQLCGDIHFSESLTQGVIYFDNLVKARSVHADFTVGKLNGKRVAIGIRSDGKANVLYVMNHSKGHEAAKLLPIKDAPVLITDREPTFLNDYGIHHQICLEHLRRDLNDVLQNDPDRQWAKEMRDLICTLWDKAKTWDKRRGLPKEERRAYERKYDEILNLAEKEYEKKPARKSLPQGPNLMAALRRMKKHVLYFSAASMGSA